MLDRNACVFVLLLAACTRSTPVTLEPTPPVSSPKAIPGATAVRSWTLIPNVMARRYVSTGTTVFELLSDTSAARASIMTTAVFSVAIFREPESATIRGTLHSFSTQTTSRIPQPARSPVTPFLFSGKLVDGGFSLDSINGELPGTGDCRNPYLNSLSAVRQGLLVVPAVLTSGLTWVDSSTVPACSGSIPLRLTAVKTYIVSGESYRNGSPVLVLDRVDRFIASGEGAQGQHRMTVLTRGTGSAKIYVDRISGLLSSAASELQGQVTINASGRTQVFNQTVKEVVELAN